MKDFLTFVFAFSQVVVLSLSQKVAPGVPPQQYQQYQQPPPPPPHHTQQYQQVPQYQQPTHHQQVPIQQQQQIYQQQVPVQQIHQQQPQHGHGHGAPQQLLHTGNLAMEKEHIQEHLDVPIDTSKMSEAELQFHYFKMHDADNNNKLDGCELIKSLIHWHEEGHKDPHGQVPSGQGKLFKDEELTSLIDPILAMDDGNGDGYIDYPEFVRAQQKAAAKPGP